MKWDILKNKDGQDNNLQWLLLLRCGISAIGLLHFLAIQADFANLFSEHGFVPPDIADALQSSVVPSVYTIFKTLHKSFNRISYENILLAVRILYPLFLVLLFVGLFTRVAALLTLLLQLILLNSMDFYTYGVDGFTTIAFFYCFIFPVGNVFSLDNLLFKGQPYKRHYQKYLRLFQAHVCIMYFFSGFEKLLGFNWRNGESIWKMMHSYNNTDIINLDFLYNTPFFLIAGWAVVLLEMLYPIFINIAATRKVWLYSIVLFHVGIAFFMGLYFFSCVMIILNLTVYYIPFVKTENSKQKFVSQKLPLLQGV